MGLDNLAGCHNSKHAACVGAASTAWKDPSPAMYCEPSCLCVTLQEMNQCSTAAGLLLTLRIFQSSACSIAEQSLLLGSRRSTMPLSKYISSLKCFELHLNSGMVEQLDPNKTLCSAINSSVWRNSYIATLCLQLKPAGQQYHNSICLQSGCTELLMDASPFIGPHAVLRK